MSLEDTIGSLNDAEVCSVCGKGLAGCGPFARLRHGAHTVLVCCPMCLEVFQSNPAPHLARLMKLERHRMLHEAVRQTLPDATQTPPMP